MRTLTLTISRPGHWLDGEAVVLERSGGEVDVRRAAGARPVLATLRLTPLGWRRDRGASYGYQALLRGERRDPPPDYVRDEALEAAAALLA